ncbi:MAG: FKBP-type peptidyl-prolyl cis-trans isomerase [Spirochaetes bacterium]|nr:FKBP-type peptidyl-prolyl cis-trans isomerase [Spirochaetota bacterium]
MRKLFYALLVLAAIAMVACTSEAKPGSTSFPENADADAQTSYAFGVALGYSLQETKLQFSYNELMRGISDVLEGNETEITQEEAYQVIQTAVEAEMAKVGEASAAAEAEYLAENGKRAGVVTTASGLQYEVISEGTGPKPAVSDLVKIHYEGTLPNGTVFDSSIERGEPVVFPLDQVIEGFSEGVQLMTVGSKYRLYMPSTLAYGPEGAGGDIGPNQTLIFEVELISIESAAISE